MMTTDNHIHPIHQRNQLVWQHVEGWVGDRVFSVLQWIDEYHNERQVSGDIVEIGVHHGKLLLMMAALLRHGERAVAIDLWEDQRLNVDSSGLGNSEIFKAHAAKIALDSDIRLLSGDSMTLRAEDIRQEMASRSVRLFSVDGGHMPSHVVNDLSLAQELIAPGGIVALDDFFGPAWPTVTEGFYKFMDRQNLRLAPFLVFQNKLWLTTFSEQKEVLESAAAFFHTSVGAEWHERWRYSQISDWKVLTFA